MYLSVFQIKNSLSLVAKTILLSKLSLRRENSKIFSSRPDKRRKGAVGTHCLGPLEKGPTKKKVITYLEHVQPF